MRNPLFIKLSLGLLGLLLLLGSLIAVIGGRTVENYYDEANQRLHKDLAQFTADHEDPFNDDLEVDTTAIQAIMNSMMIINPDVEVYLLDRTGKLITYVAPYKKVVRERINLEPIRRFVKAKGEISIQGDDPRSLSGQKVFSAAPILKDEKTVGYYYIILASQERATALSLLKDNYAVNLGLKLLGISLFLSFLFGGLFLWYTTRKLIPIYDAMDDFSAGKYGTRIDDKKSDFSKLASTYNHMANDIEESIEKIKSIDNFRRELIANISHDIRTPLTVINGYAETLLFKADQLSQEQREEYFGFINESTKRATGLLNQMIELSKLENSQLEVVKEPFPLDELVGDLVARYKVILEKKGINIKYDRPENSTIAFGDISLIERVIQNLLDNAIKYSPNNSQITIHLDNDPSGQIIFTISDEGRGIEQSQISKIFDRYQRINPDKKDNKSMGLGLAIARKALELHNSTLEVKSKLDVGTSFSFGLVGA